MSKARTPSRHRHARHRYPFAIRRSRIAGRGAFARRRIRKGQLIIEYLGEIISQKEADRRYPEDGKVARHHTFLFEIDAKHVIDAAANGNDARFINHSCQPNCDAIDEEGRIFIYANKNIQPGGELAYDYRYARDAKDGPKDEAMYPCRCGSTRCRGTIMEPKKRKRQTASGKRQAANGKRKRQ